MVPDVALPPQRMMDSNPRDGPLSVAFHVQPGLHSISQVRPSPKTGQYKEDPFLPRRPKVQPRESVDICGWVVDSINPENPRPSNSVEAGLLNIFHHNTRMVFQCISGWNLMIWRNQEDFEAGIYGARRAPRAVAWFDLRRAWGVNVDIGSHEIDAVPYRVTVNMDSGNYYFCVDAPEDVEAWYQALRHTIHDASRNRVRSVDTKTHQEKRWPAACGIADVLLYGDPVGDRALAILFHAYDVDYDHVLRLGEIMVLIEELLAGLLAAEGRVEGSDRDFAIMSAKSRVSEDEIFSKAWQFRRRCDQTGDGKVRKDDFILYGQEAMLEALDIGGGDMASMIAFPNA